MRSITPYALEELDGLQVLQHEDIPDRLKNTAFGILRQLCGTFQRLPDSCLIGEQLQIDCGMPSATRICSDLRKGNLKGEIVAVKLLRLSTGDNRPKVINVTSSFGNC